MDAAWRLANTRVKGMGQGNVAFKEMSRIYIFPSIVGRVWRAPPPRQP